MEEIYVTRSKTVAANTVGRITIAPPTATAKWRLKSLSITLNEAIATDATDFVELTPKKASTSLAVVKSTVAASIAQGVTHPYVITGVGDDLECTQAAPHFLLIDATPGAGKLADVELLAVYSQMVG